MSKQPALLDMNTLPHRVPMLDDLFSTLKPGFFVKVGVPSHHGNEFFWVSITSIQDGELTGIVANDLEYSNCHRYHCDDVISKIKAIHICEALEA